MRDLAYQIIPFKENCVEICLRPGGLELIDYIRESHHVFPVAVLVFRFALVVKKEKFMWILL